MSMAPFPMPPSAGHSTSVEPGLTTARGTPGLPTSLCPTPHHILPLAPSHPCQREVVPHTQIPPSDQACNPWTLHGFQGEGMNLAGSQLPHPLQGPWPQPGSGDPLCPAPITLAKGSRERHPCHANPPSPGAQSPSNRSAPQSSAAAHTPPSHQRSSAVTDWGEEEGRALPSCNKGWGSGAADRGHTGTPGGGGRAVMLLPRTLSSPLEDSGCWGPP